MSSISEFFSRLEVVIPAAVAGGAGLTALVLPFLKDLIKILKSKSEAFTKIVDTLHNLICDKEDKREIKKKNVKKKK